MVLQWLMNYIQRLNRSESIYDIVYLNYLFSKFFGMSIYTIAGDSRNPTITMTWRDMIAFFRLLTIQVISFLVSFVAVDRALESTGSTIMDIGMKYSFTIGSFYILVLAVSIYGRYRPLSTIFAKMDQFDKWAIQINAPVCHRAQKRRLWQSLALNIILLTILIISFSVIMSDLSLNFGVTFAFVCFAIPFALFVHHLAMLGYLVFCRLDHLNDTFAVNFIPPKNPTMVMLEELPAPRSNRDKEKVLQQLQLQWTEIGQVVELISNTYFKQIVFITIATTISCTFSMFVFYRAMITQEYLQQLTASVYLQSNWYLMFLVLVMISVFDKIKQKGKRTAALVHKALRELSNDRIRDELMRFSLFLGHKRIVVNCFIFECDWTLGMSLISAIISYLVILIQFDASLVTTVSKVEINATVAGSSSSIH